MRENREVLNGTAGQRKTEGAAIMTRRIRKPVAIAILLAFAVSWLPGSAPVPRKSPELRFLNGLEQPVLLSSFKGKVVLIEFMFIRSPRCLRVAQTMNKLNSELGPRGFQPVAIAFPAPGSDASGPLVNYLVDYFKLRYPVGYASDKQVDTYLGRGKDDVLNVPQIVVIDRAGMIRAASGGRGGDPKLEDENSLRTLIDTLLKEKPPAKNTK
jgi:thiol-disulfide isomerase/thioredoxin